MAAQLRPNRMAVTDRFPMLSFTVRAGSAPCITELVLVTNPDLVRRKEGRTPATFYSSREHGLLSIARGEAVFMVPPEVLARFVGANRLWYGLASSSATPSAGTTWTVDVLPDANSPYISLSGLSDRALRRVRMFPTSGGLGGRRPLLDWAGDATQPGSTAVPASSAPAFRSATSQPPVPQPTINQTPQPSVSNGDIHYDDGFGPLKPLTEVTPAPPATATPPVTTPTTQTGTGSAPAPVSQGLDTDIDYRIPAQRRSVTWPQPRTLGDELSDTTDADSVGADVPVDTQVEEIHYALQDGQVNKVARVERTSGVTTLVFDWGGQERRVPIMDIVDAPPGRPSTAGWTVATGKMTTLSAIVSYILLYACGKWGKGYGTEIIYEVDGKRWLAKKAIHDDTAAGGPRTSSHPGMDVYVAVAAVAAGLAMRRRPWAGALDVTGDSSQAEQSQAVLDHIARSLQQKEGTRFNQVHYDSNVVNFGIGSWTGPRIATVLDSYETFATEQGSTATLYGYFGGQSGFNDLRSRFRSNSVPTPMAAADKGALESLGGDTSLRDAQVRLLASEVKKYVDAIATDNKYPFIDGYMNAVTEVAAHVLVHAVHQHGQVNDLVAEVIADHGGGDAFGQEISSGTMDEHKFLGEIGEAVTRRVKAEYKNGVRARYKDLITQFERSELGYFFNPQPTASANTPADGGGDQASATPAASFSLGLARSLSDDPEAYGIDEPPYSEDDVSAADVPATASALALGARENSLVTRTEASPNFNEGRGGKKIDRIIIHITDVPLVKSVVNHFVKDPTSKVSSHYLVGQDGEVLQFVSEADTARHCVGWNQRSIGIEHIAVKRGGADYEFKRKDGSKGIQHYDALAPSQLEYETSAALVASLCDKYSLPINRTTIMGHREADSSTGHTSCPDGNWDWDYFMRLVTSRTCQPQDASQSFGFSARALDAEDWTINWDDVKMIPQPTNMSCWATAAAMVTGWRDNKSVDPTLLARYSGMDSSLNGGLAPKDKRAFADAIGLVVHPNACYTPDGFRQILEANGPIWVTADVPGIHAVVVTGMYLQNGQQYVRITDPWDRIVGSPGAQGDYLATHSTGSRYIMSWDSFSREFEAAGNVDRIQLLHSGGTFGHTINRGSAAKVGYALGTEPPAPGGEFGYGVTLTRTASSNGGCSYDLAQLTGLVQPANALAGGAGREKTSGPRITLDEWPYIDGPSGRTSAPVAIDWDWQGGAVGNVVITPAQGQMRDGWTAQVRADISRATGTPERASLRLRIATSFRHAGEEEQVAVTEVLLNGDGRFQTTHGADSAPPSSIGSTRVEDRELQPV